MKLGSGEKHRMAEAGLIEGSAHFTTSSGYARL